MFHAEDSCEQGKEEAAHAGRSGQQHKATDNHRYQCEEFQLVRHQQWNEELPESMSNAFLVQMIRVSCFDSIIGASRRLEYAETASNQLRQSRT